MIKGCPSYVMPGTWWENINYIETNLPEISNVELLFFIYDDETKRLIAPEIEKILGYSGRLSFSVHLPDPILPEHEELLDLFVKLSRHFIIHPPLAGSEPSYKGMIDNWRKKYGNIFLLENLIGKNHSWFLKNTDWPLCLDTGHAILRGHSPSLFLDLFFERIKEIHLHDVHKGKDHSPLSTESIWLEHFIPKLKNFPGIVNMELFDAKKVRDSFGVFKGLQVKLTDFSGYRGKPALSADTVNRPATCDQ